MIREYIFVVLLSYIEYFFFFFILEYKKEITWDKLKFWLKYTPLICLFFFLIDSWYIATMIYVTFFFPYLLIIYCIKEVNRVKFGINKIIVFVPLIKKAPHSGIGLIHSEKKLKK